MTWAEVSIRLFHLESANRDDHQIAQITLPSGTNNQTSETVDNTYNTRTGLQTKAVSSVHGVIVDDTTWNNAGQLRTRLYGTNGANGVVDLRYSASSLWMTENRGGSTGSTGGWQNCNTRMTTMETSPESATSVTATNANASPTTRWTG